MSKKRLYESKYSPFSTSSIQTNYKRLSALREADEEQEPVQSPEEAPAQAAPEQPKKDVAPEPAPEQSKCKVIMQILKNGKPIKKYCCPDEKLLPKHFAYVYKMLGKMENGKDDFKVVTHKEQTTKQESVNEVSPKGWEKTIKGMKKNKKIDNPYALANWMKSKGYKHKK